METSLGLLTAAGFAMVIAFIFSLISHSGGSLYSLVLILPGYTVEISTRTSLLQVLITCISAGSNFLDSTLHSP